MLQVPVKQRSTRDAQEHLETCRQFTALSDTVETWDMYPQAAAGPNTAHRERKNLEQLRFTLFAPAIRLRKWHTFLAVMLPCSVFT